MNKQLVRIISGVGLLAVALVFVSPARAADQVKAAEKQELRFEGVLTATDATAGTVTVKQKDKDPMTFTLGKSCRFFVKHLEGRATLADLSTGKKIVVLYAQEHNMLVAHRVSEPGSKADEKERKLEKQGK